MSKFASLDSIKKKKEPSDGSDDEDATNTYYTGGTNARGGGSGLNVLAPPNRDKEGDDRDPYSAIVNRAKKDAKAKPIQNENLTQVTLYRNGFTVGEGQFRARGVAANDAFVDALAQGICPPELMLNGKPQDIKLVEKSGEDYVPPAYTAFTGEGNSIGRGSALNDDVIFHVNELTPVEQVSVDEAEPKVRVQVLYPDKSRQRLTFNKRHTIGDLASVVAFKARQPFVMLDPKKQPIDKATFGVTLTDAGLSMALVTVTYNL